MNFALYLDYEAAQHRTRCVTELDDIGAIEVCNYYCISNKISAIHMNY